MRWFDTRHRTTVSGKYICLPDQRVKASLDFRIMCLDWRGSLKNSIKMDPNHFLLQSYVIYLRGLALQYIKSKWNISLNWLMTIVMGV